jgi:rsbT co-antagonist protein RsbR
MEGTREGFTHSLMTEMGLEAGGVERRRKLAGITADDVARVRTLKKVVEGHADALANVFFQTLAATDDARALLANRELAEQARRLKVEHLLAMTDGEYGVSYVEQRVRLALLYSRGALEQRAFYAAFGALVRALGELVMREAGRPAADAVEAYGSLTKIAFFDMSIIADVLAFERERVIRQQQEAIRELTTPVLQVRERMLLLPIIGVIDTYRARLITENLLRSIRATRAKVVVMDVTGVATIDSKVANHLLQTIAAARLMGASVIVTGLSSDVAQSLVALGIELAKLNTVGDLQGGLEEAEALLGMRVVAAPPSRRLGRADDLDEDARS